MIKARTQLIVSLLFLLSSVALWNLLVPNRAAPSTTPAVVAASETLPIQVEGVWEQYLVYGCQREFMARLDIRKAGDDYIATPLSLSANTYPKHAYRSFNHTYQNGHWTFSEDWDYGEVGEFSLELQPNGQYWGVARSNSDGHTFKTLFVRVGN